MSRFPGPLGIARWVARRPTGAVRIARDRKLWAWLVMSDGLPSRVRQVLYGPAGAVARLALRRSGDHAIAAPLAVVAARGLGRMDEAIALAEHGTATGRSATVARLARIAIALERPDLASRWIDGRAASTSTTSGGSLQRPDLRGEVAYRLGRYRAADALLTEALAQHPRSRRIARLRTDARGELALLDPAWRPAVGPRPAGARQPGRVLHLLTNSLPYRQAGYTLRAQEVARSQQAVGLDPRMVTRAGFPGTDGILDAATVDVVDGVTYHRIEPGLEPALSVDRIATETAIGLMALARDLRPAVLQPTTNYVNAQVALAVGEAWDLPVVYEVRGFLEETWRSQMGDVVADSDRVVAARAVETACMRRATMIVTLSETVRADILGRGEIDPDRVVVIPNAVDVERFTPGPRDDALAAELGIEREETVVGYISSLTGYEGIAYLIEAVAMLRRGGQRVRLLIVGDGDERRRLEAVAGRAGMVKDRGVIFTGRVPHAEIERYYRTIDIFVVPRTNDRVSRLVTPMKPYEAMAMAMAIVVSRTPALEEIVHDEETGLLAEPEDAASLADAIGRLVDDPATRARLGAAARVWVAENRTWALNGERYLALYQRLGVA